MKMLQWLMSGDPAIARLAAKYLLEEPLPYTEDGYIGRYLERFDPQRGLWGGGVYGPKWTSTHYTLMELKYMEIDPQNEAYQRGLQRVLEGEWCADNPKASVVHNDLCVIGMLVSLATYGRIEPERLAPLIDYLLDHRMPDGAWNCQWDRKDKKPMKSSLHTTLSVLESIGDYVANGYTYRVDALRKAQLEGEAFILSKRLFRRATTGQVIREAFTQFHYPPRWQYDCVRALEYFAGVKRPLDPRMQEGLDLVIKALEKGLAPKGTQYSGKIHFKLETGKGSRFNTLRALKIIKHFAPDQYKFICEREV